MSPHIFISYSRVDKSFTEHFIARLRRLFPDVEIWYDDELHGGELWWDEIINQIAACDVFIYLLSNESVQSAYCQAEFTEARRLQKRVITVQIRDRTELTDDLDDIQYVDMKAGVDDPEVLTRLGGAVRLQLSKARKKRPLWQPRTPKPVLTKEQSRPANTPDVVTPNLHVPVNPRQEISWYRDSRFIVSAILVPLIVAVIGGAFTLLNNANNTPTLLAPTNTLALLATPPSSPGVEVTTQVPISNLPVTAIPAPGAAASPQPPGTLTAELSRLFPAELPGCVEAGSNADAARGNVNLYFDREQHDRALGCARRVYELQGDQASHDQQRLVELGQCQNPTMPGGLGGKPYLDNYMALSNVGNSLYVAGKSYRALNDLTHAAAVWNALIEAYHCAWVGDGVTMWSPAEEAQKRLILLTPQP
ncbi:MAG: toll/interleukin-1 receptor domain-containing protein [Chloroflexi bacterium]|nr:toll/interleukin-1 receptor domain-containing protein [Chloroflexota bacterium]